MSFLKNAIDAIDPAPNKKTELTLARQTLFELVEQKTTLFKRELELNLRTAGSPDNQTIPSPRSWPGTAKPRAYVKDDAAKLSEVILGSIRNSSAAAQTKSSTASCSGTTAP